MWFHRVAENKKKRNRTAGARIKSVFGKETQVLLHGTALPSVQHDESDVALETRSVNRMEIRQMSYERAIQWRHVVLGIISDFVGGTWDLDRCVVMMRGLPGAGKSMFADLLAREFREEFHFEPSRDGNPRMVRICTMALYDVTQGRDDASGQRFIERDVKSSLEAAHVVIVDDAHVATEEWEWVVKVAHEYWREAGIHGKVYMVNIACRDEELAGKLNRRTWRPLSDEAIQQLYEVFAALEAEVADLPNCFTVDPEI